MGLSLLRVKTEKNNKSLKTLAVQSKKFDKIFYFVTRSNLDDKKLLGEISWTLEFGRSFSP